jgi:hypothetical protein
VAGYLAAVLADAPLHYWRCADPGGALAHDIGSSPFALVSGSAYAAALGYSGPNNDGGAVQCDTGSGFLTSWLSFVPSAAMTFEAIAWPHDYAQVQGTVLGQTGVGDTRIGFLVTTGQPFAVAGGVAAIGAAGAPQQRWHHLVGTFAAGVLICYLDGVQVALVAGAALGNGIFAIGARANASDLRFEGAVSEAAVYGAALSAARVAAHFGAIDSLTARPVYRAFGGSSYPTSTAPVGPGTEFVSKIYQNAP